jgi:aldehyde:ferredoxin oxidoreductase
VVDQNLADFGGTLDPHGTEGQVEASRNTQIHMAAVDTMGLCDFAQSGLSAEGGFDHFMRMISAKLGRPFDSADWQALGRRVLTAERDFNRRAGFTNRDDRLPRMFYEEPLPPHNTVVVISDAQMDETFDF